MDLLTQLDNALDLLLQIMSSSIAYTSRKAKHAPLPLSSVPLTVLGKTESIEADEMELAIAELVEDLVAKAEQVREIIQHLPTEGSLGGEEELGEELQRLQSELRVANGEYRRVRQEVASLKAEVEQLVKVVCEGRAEGRIWLVGQLEAS